MVQTVKPVELWSPNMGLVPNRLPRTAVTGRELSNIANVVESPLQVEMRQRRNYCGVQLAMVDCQQVQKMSKWCLKVNLLMSNDWLHKHNETKSATGSNTVQTVKRHSLDA